ncbi:MAG: GNAT family N-acetyltransferase [Bacteroidetes bacterium]|nr:GNAT family N-acetyltransferase [Bacteroidota bacterium]
MESNIFIRQADIEDCKVIVDIGRKTFKEAYSEISNHGVIENYLEDKFSEGAIASELNNTCVTFYIGFSDNAPVAFTTLRNDRKARGLEQQNALEIEGIYVLKEFQGVKVGREMLTQSIAVATSAGYDLIWLQVWQKNMKAIQFYQKAGFVIYETAVSGYRNEITQSDFLMRFNLYY